MDIADIVTEEYVEHSPETTVSKLVGTFADSDVRGVVVQDEEFEGIVTRRQLATSHRQPNEKLRSLVWHVPRLTPDEDIRKVAQLMIDSESQLLPVFEGRELIGVVTADGILQKVEPYLDAAAVAEAYSGELVSLEPSSTLGNALNVFRQNRITHLPVVENDSAAGVLSLYDVTEITVRSEVQSQGGDAGGVDPFGGEISSSTARSRRGGYGAREGESTRMLDVPVRDLMTSPVRTIRPDETLDVAVTEMFDAGASSLVVTENGSPHGIVTKTDCLESLTWEAGGNRGVQVYGTDLIDDVTYDEIVAMVEKFDDRDQGMNVLDTKVHLHEHDEKRRGTPLVLARVRLHTDRGLYVASGEGYGAKHAMNEARDVLERQIRDRKTHGRTKKPPDETFWEKRFGWLLEE
ncbi:CBS domain-containing protein [Natrarchaeobaculum sulfurireducens]|uniref:Protein containing two CBS domains (Some fused to C-terminal double-stranded RNA-binding domain of RaiA family) n=1 Tax=Natrarchaeobaculum sulfurireducens TaxID=2044521 RepID=A0A346PG73_9EURY|nr:CBS domain-containing protein [Natrarchaeobaculum sulfurireducens]AXR78518.1 Protein containing two CBS domains (some fused to C-terminal double-stranded RNA-binding domain of RaiA family) [Natrarchaeobaculum sulfurireducens]